MNVALTLADDGLLHGEGRDPLRRPDRRAARPARRAAVGVPRGRRAPRPSERPTPNGGGATAGAASRGDGQRQTHASRSATCRSASAASRALNDVSFDVRAGRDPRVHRPQRRRQDDPVRRHLRLPARRRRHDPPRDRPRQLRPDAQVRRRPAPSSDSAGRSRTGGCSRRSPCRRPSRSRSRRTSKSRESARRRRCTCRTCMRSERRSASAVDELIELVGLGAFRDKFVHELSTGSRRIVDLACVLAHEPDRAAARRAVERHRPARGRGARSAAARASATRSARRCSSSSTTCR